MNYTSENIRLLRHTVNVDFDINQTGNDYFVADIHGTFDRVTEILNEVDFDFENDRLFCMGDLFDRGNSHRGILNFINQPWFNVCLGNHDDDLMDIFEYIDGQFNRCEVLSDGRVIDADNGNVYTVEEFYHQELYYADREYMEEFTMEEIASIREFLAGVPLMMRVNTSEGQIGMVHAEIPNGMSFQETVDWIESLEGREAVVARTYLFYGERGLFETDVNFLFANIFFNSDSQVDVDAIVNNTANDLHILYMGHNIMPIANVDDVAMQRRVDYDTGNLMFIDHGSFITEDSVNNAFGIGLYNDQGQMVAFQ